MNESQAITAAAGMVRIQAQTMLVAMPQRTALKRWMVPTPAIEPRDDVRGGDRLVNGQVAKRMEMAAAVSAQKPLRGLSRVRRPPMVCTMRQPPLSVPRAMAAWAARITQTGTLKILQITGGHQHAGDDPHRLLRVVGAVRKAERRRRDQLQLAEIRDPSSAGVEFRKSQ